MQQKNCLLNDEFIKYQFLAVSIASRYKNYNVEQQDLVQASYLGLIIGLNKCNIENEKHKINYISKYILSEIINTLKSHNKYNYNKEYFKTIKILKENENLSVNELVSNYDLNKKVIIDILVNENFHEETQIDNNQFLTLNQKKIYNLVVLRKYSITKTAKILNKKRNKILQEVKEIYNLIKGN